MLKLLYHENNEITVEQVRDALIARGCKPKRDVNGFRAICPAHSGADGLSLTVHPKDGGGVLMRCHSHKCDYETILRALGLWNAPNDNAPGDSAAGTASYPPHSYVEGDAIVYQYLDESGAELYQNVRKPQKQFRQRRVTEDGEIVWGLKGTPAIPFGLPELAASEHRYATVYITEGEKDTITLRGHGFLAVSLADSAVSELNQKHFQSRHVIILEDNDDAGRTKSKKRSEWLQGTAASVKVMTFTDLPEKGDVSDWFEAGGTPESFRRRVGALAPVATSADVSAWKTPDPLQAESGPPLDLELLPDDWREFCEAQAAAHQTPVEMVFTTALGAASAAAAGMFTVYRWNEPVHAMCISVARPGLKKSALMSALTGALLRWQSERQEQDRLEIANWESTERALTKTRDRLEGEPRKGEESGTNRDLQRRAAIQELHEHQAEKPLLTTLVIDDATPQAVAWHLIEQPSIAVVSAESAYLENFYRYGDTPDFNAYLQGHAGDPLHVHRRSGQSAYTDSACLALCMAVQPHAIKRMGGVDGFMQRGGAARLLMAIPEDNAGNRLTGRNVPAMPEGLKDWWASALRRLLDLRTPKMPPRHLLLTSEALATVEKFEAIVETRYRFLGDDDAMRGWMSKQIGAALRIAGLLHLISHDSSVPIDHHTVGRGIALSEWYRAHASVAFTMMEGSGDDLARTVWTALCEGGGAPMNRRELHLGLRGQTAFKKSTDLDAPLEMLEERGYIRIRKVETGGRPTEWIDLNPLALPTKSVISSHVPIAEMYKPELAPTGTDKWTPEVF